jgi:predicted amidohydrolase YtcJ
VTLLRDVEVAGARCDVRLAGEVVVDIGSLADAGDEVVEGRGGALLPGLHDHHLHLLAMAAADRSVDVSAGLQALIGHHADGWLRAVGWSGDGDRYDVDAVMPQRPVRVQHRSGALWVVNSAGVRALDLRNVHLAGVERDATGEPTGRLWRMDAWVAERLGRTAPDLAAVADRLARLGITGVTDATPDLDRDTCALLRTVPQRLLLLGDPDGDGPVKVVLPDHALPSLDELVARVEAARPRPVAVHCVTREAYVLLLTALDIVGHHPGDRIEHGAVIPASLPPRCAVVTQPGFLLARGDDYLRDIPPADLPDLYRHRSLLDAGCTVVASSDAPYGPLDPWAVLRAARDRTTRSGQVLGAAERVPARAALDGLLRPLQDVTRPPRQVQVGAAADLVLLHVPLAEMLADPDAGLVRQTWLRGVSTVASQG